ncbi:MAG: hypothetical protein D6705_07155 [Deltaproteobacteria bacterium]|nr:MAG: hypothetical protein D6705_07155 [Deltaproteobacteria bacterium]
MTEASGPPHDPTGPRLSVVLGVVAVVAVAMGILATYRYGQSEAHFREIQAEMDAKGPNLDVEGCVDAVLSWHASCSANKPLCDHGVPKIMTHCLAGRDRSEACAKIEGRSARAQWVFDRCAERGTPCKSRKKCPCADAFRALDSFCRHGQKGVAM